jgi:hypothetical protein
MVAASRTNQPAHARINSSSKQVGLLSPRISEMALARDRGSLKQHSKTNAIETQQRGWHARHRRRVGWVRLG